jgi:hypothetical protein
MNMSMFGAIWRQELSGRCWSRAFTLCALRETIVVVNPLALQSTAYRSMSSGTARLKRRLDEQGINYGNKKAVENFCLVRLTATEGLWS